jgi:hypothetical protein
MEKTNEINATNRASIESNGLNSSLIVQNQSSLSLHLAVDEIHPADLALLAL